MLPDGVLKNAVIEYEPYNNLLPVDHYGLLACNILLSAETEPLSAFGVELLNDVENQIPLDIENIMLQLNDWSAFTNIDKTKIFIDMTKYSVYGTELLFFSIKFLTCPFQNKLLLSDETWLTEQMSEDGYVYINTTYDNLYIYPIKDSNGSTVNNCYFVYKKCLGTKCEKWDIENGRCSLKTYNYWKSLNVNTMTSDPILDAIILMTEFISNQDLDNDGYVYGYDFYIRETENIPPMLLTIKQNTNFPDPPPVSLTWDEYKLAKNNDININNYFE